PGGKMPALLNLVVVDELRIRPLGPTPRSLIDLIEEGAHGDRDGDTRRGEEGKLVLPIDARRGNRRVGQPRERNIVEDVIPRQASGPAVEGAGDELVAELVVIEEP